MDEELLPLTQKFYLCLAIVTSVVRKESSLGLCADLEEIGSKFRFEE